MSESSDTWPLRPAILHALPPAQVVNHRTTRYARGTWTVPLAAFVPADQTLLRELYQMLTAVWDQLRVTEPTPGRVLHAIRAVVWRSGWYGVLQALPQLGVATGSAPHAEELAGVLEVVRAGNLAVLHGTLPLLGLAPVTPGTMTALVSVVRDHLTTLRSVIPDLDPVAAATDQVPQPQTLDRLVVKWRYLPYGVGHTVGDVRVVVAAPGAVAAHGREWAAVDTVLTTLITAAVQQAVDGIVYVVVLPHGDQDVRLGGVPPPGCPHGGAHRPGARLDGGCGVCGRLLWCAHRAAVPGRPVSRCRRDRRVSGGVVSLASGAGSHRAITPRAYVTRHTRGASICAPNAARAPR